jgi:hypothetical protein
MDITYNYVPLFIDNDWSLVSIVPPNLNSQIQPQNINLIASIYDEFKTDKAINNVTSNINTSNINSSDIDIININDINNHITIAEIYDEENEENQENEKKSIFDLGNLKSKNRYIDKKNVLLGFGN